MNVVVVVFALFTVFLCQYVASTPADDNKVHMDVCDGTTKKCIDFRMIRLNPRIGRRKRVPVGNSVANQAKREQLADLLEVLQSSAPLDVIGPKDEDIHYRRRGYLSPRLNGKYVDDNFSNKDYLFDEQNLEN